METVRVMMRVVLAVLLAATAFVLVPASGAAAPTGSMDEWDLAVLPLPNTAIAYDATRDQVLVGVDRTHGSLGNGLVEVDPDTGALGRSVVVGAGLERIVVAEDGSRAYVVLGDSPVVVEVDLDSFTVTRRISTGFYTQSASSTWPLHPVDLVVMPDDPEVIVVASAAEVARRVAVFDAGVQRPDTVAPSSRPNRLVAAADGERVHATATGTFGGGLMTFLVDGDGITEERSASVSVGDGIVLFEDLVHADNGAVVDPDDGSLRGRYGRSGRLALDEASATTYILEDATLLTRHDARTLIGAGTRSLPVESDALVWAGGGLVAGDGTSLTLVGPDVRDDALALPASPSSLLRVDDGWTSSLQVSALAAAPDGEAAYATTPMAAADHPGSLVEVVPATGEVRREVFVGGEPSLVAVSDDGSVAYVGHSSASIVTEVDLETFTIRRTVSIYAQGGQVAFARSIAPSPGDADRYLVAAESASYDAVVLVADGVVAPDALGGGSVPAYVSFAGDPSEAVGVWTGSPTIFVSMSVDDDGLQRTGLVRDFGDNGPGPLHRVGSLLYDGSRGLIDPRVPHVVAQLPAREVGVLDVAHDRIYLLGTRAEPQSTTTLHEVSLSRTSDVALRRDGIPQPARSGVVAGDHLLVELHDGRLHLVPLGVQAPRSPDAPGTPIATPGDGEAHLRWTPPPWDGGDEVAGYRIYQDGEPVAEVGPDTWQATVGELENDRRYAFRVAAVNGAGEGPQSFQVLVTPYGVPDVPRTVVATPGDGEIALSWLFPADDGGSNVTGYRIYLDGELVEQVAASPRSTVVGGLVNGERHEVSISAVNARGEGPASEPVVTSALASPEVPEVPRSVDATPGVRSVTVTWQPPAFDGGAPITGYQVLLDGEIVHHLGASSRTTTVQGLAPGEPRAVTVLAVNEVGEGPSSEEVVVTPLRAEPAFDDVGVEHPFFDEIAWVAERGIATGHPDGTFRPGAEVTRQAAAAFLHRLAGQEWYEPPAAPTFADVAPTHPFFADVEWAAEREIVAGWADGTFRPSATVSRQAMAAFLHRMAGAPEVALPDEASFSDVPASHPFAAEIEWGAAQGITTGYADGRFRPAGVVTRQATAAFLLRLWEGPGIEL